VTWLGCPAGGRAHTTQWGGGTPGWWSPFPSEGVRHRWRALVDHCIKHMVDGQNHIACTIWPYLVKHGPPRAHACGCGGPVFCWHAPCSKGSHCMAPYWVGHRRCVPGGGGCSTSCSLLYAAALARALHCLQVNGQCMPYTVCLQYALVSGLVPHGAMVLWCLLRVNAGAGVDKRPSRHCLASLTV
jgi:hypothetical protein